MTSFEIGMWSFPVLLALIFLRIPIAIAMLSVGFLGNYVVTQSTGMMLSQMKHLVYGTFSNYSFSIIFHLVKIRESSNLAKFF